jgi:hypothetical protein
MATHRGTEYGTLIRLDKDLHLGEFWDGAETEIITVPDQRYEQIRVHCVTGSEELTVNHYLKVIDPDNDEAMYVSCYRTVLYPGQSMLLNNHTFSLQAANTLDRPTLFLFYGNSSDEFLPIRSKENSQ